MPSIPRSLVCAGLLAASASPSLRAQWGQKAPSSSPPARIHAAMTFAPNTGGVLLFGGVTTTAGDDDTWTFGNGTWTQLSPATSPPPRWDMEMVYDSARGVAVMYGGYVGSFLIGPGLSDTWEWNGTTWSQVATTGNPGPRFGYAACFDSVRNRTMLFGGWVSHANPLLPTGLWEYDGATWSSVATTGNVPSFLGQAMCFHPGWNRAVLFSWNETWLYDATLATWTKFVTTGPTPPARRSPTLTYDAERAVCVLTGGHTNGVYLTTSGPLADTWIFDGSTWIQQPFTTTAVTLHEAAFEPTGKQIVKFGGQTSSGSPTNATWGLGAGTLGAGCAGTNGTPRLTASQAPRLGQPWTLGVSNLDPTFNLVLLVFGFTQFPGGIDLGPLLGMPGCRSFNSPDIFLPAVAGVPGSATWSWTPVSGSIGDSFYCQALCLDPTVNPFGWTISNAIYASIGN